MHIKIVQPDSFSFGQPTSSLLKVSSRGLIGNDRRDFEKVASCDILRGIDELIDQCKPGDVLSHQIALGATEVTGPNRNGDGFTKRACREHHPTFVKHGFAFRNHRNKCPKKSYGRPIKSAYNEEMGRVELITRYNGTKEAADRNGGLVADQEIDKLSSGKPLALSMACLVDPNAPILTSRGYKRIADIQVGDLVHTHRGRWRKVTELRHSTYTGDVVTLNMVGLPYPLELTAEHPMFAKILQDYPTEENRRPVGQWRHEVLQGAEPFEWLHVKHLRRGDRVAVSPILHVPGRLRIEDTRFAELLGTYLAEGSLPKQNNKHSSVTFTVNVNDWATDNLQALVNDIWPGVGVALKPKSNSEVAFDLNVYSTTLAQWIFKLCGEYSDKKTVPLELFNSAEEIKLAVLGRWLDGDGFVDKKGVHWSSCNFHLLLGARELLLSCGIPASIHKIEHKAGRGLDMPAGTEYTLNAAWSKVSKMQTWSQKLQNAPAHYWETAENSHIAALTYVNNDYWTSRVSSVVVRTVDSVPVYNFEVEEDASYNLAGFCSHNCLVDRDFCSYCDNPAPSTSKYCVGIEDGGHCKAGGLRDNIGQVIEVDGNMHHLHADNRTPKFFDISDVFRPADRTAYAFGLLQKRASGQLIKSAEIADSMGLQIPPHVLLDTYELLGANPTLVKLAAAERDVEGGHFWNTYAAAFTAGGDLGTDAPDVSDNPREAQLLKQALASHGVLLSLPQYFQIFGGLSQEKAASAAAVVAPQIPGIFNRLLTSGATISPSAFSPSDLHKYAGFATKIAQHSRIDKTAINRRAIFASLQSKENPTVKTASDDRFAEDAVSAAAVNYAMYKLSFVAEVDDPFVHHMAVLQDYVH